MVRLAFALSAGPALGACAGVPIRATNDVGVLRDAYGQPVLGKRSDR